MMDHIPDRSPGRELARLFREEREGWDREADRARLVEACVAACEAEAAALERRGGGGVAPGVPGRPGPLHAARRLDCHRLRGGLGDRGRGGGG